MLVLPADRTRGPVGILLDYGRPASFPDVGAQLEWMQKAARRVLKLKMDIESGAQPIDSIVGLDLNPDVPAEQLTALRVHAALGGFSDGGRDAFVRFMVVVVGVVG